MDVTQADAFNAARGYTNWAGTNVVKAAALVRAQDYIGANYNLRSTLTTQEQSRLDSATCLLARDMLTDTSASIRAQATVTKESKELSGMKKSVEYADAPRDLYPYVTALLTPLCVATASVTYAIGKLVR